MSVDIIQIAAVTVTSAAGHRRPNLVEPHAARPTIFLTAATMTTMASAPARPLLQPRRPLPPPFVPIAGALLEILGLKVAEERPLARILCLSPRSPRRRATWVQKGGVPRRSSRLSTSQPCPPSRKWARRA